MIRIEPVASPGIESIPDRVISELLIGTGAVEVVVSIATKFFYSRRLPCTLWFLDRSTERDKKRSNNTLKLDLHEVYRKVSSILHDFTPEHLKNILVIVGEMERISGWQLVYQALNCDHIGHLRDDIQCT